MSLKANIVANIGGQAAAAAIALLLAPFFLLRLGVEAWGLVGVLVLVSACIPTAVHYPKPLHHQPAYASPCRADTCSNSVIAAQRVMSLPMSADLSEAQQDRVVAQVRVALTNPTIA